MLDGERVPKVRDLGPMRSGGPWARLKCRSQVSTPTDNVSLDCHLATAVSRFTETLEGYWTKMTSVSATFSFLSLVE